MNELIAPHGKEKILKPLLVTGPEKSSLENRSRLLRKCYMTSRETSDCIMLGIGAFTPLNGFMNQSDWKNVCAHFTLSDGTFWPIPITLSVSREEACLYADDEEIALYDEETNEIIAIMQVQQKYEIDKEYECKKIFQTTDTAHPGVEKVLSQKEYNIAGPIKVLSESYFPKTYQGFYMRPDESRKAFSEKQWKTIAALQLRNPMHRSHEYLSKIALEVLDGVFIHQLLGKLKEGDIPAEVRVKCIDALVEKYFVPNTVIHGGYPLEMRYAGPREALLHALFRQNYGCTHIIIGRDHAGVGNYYGPFDSQKIFDDIQKNSLAIQPLKIDWTFYCKICDGMASTKTCPHGKDDRLILSGTALRKMLSEGLAVPAQFSRPEVLEILKQYYQSLDKKVTIELHKTAQGEHLTNKHQK